MKMGKAAVFPRTQVRSEPRFALVGRVKKNRDNKLKIFNLNGGLPELTSSGFTRREGPVLVA
jgi:hypothetical protein